MWKSIEKGKWNSDIPKKTVREYLYKIKFDENKQNFSVYYLSTIKKINWFKRLLIKWFIGWEMELRRK